VVAVVLLAACGTSSPSAEGGSNGNAGSELPGVELESIPAGLRIGDISDSGTSGGRPSLPPGVDEWRWISYEIGGAPVGGNRVHGFVLIVTRAPLPFDSGDTRTVTVAGQSAQLGSRYLGDGVTGRALIVSRWPDAVVEVRANDSAMGDDDLLAVAATLRSLSPDEWRQRINELSFGSRDATSDPQSTRIDLGDQRQGDIRWQVSVLVPPDLNKNSTDRRKACLQLVFDGVTVAENNCGDAWTIRLVHGTRFVFGITGDAVEAVTIRSVAVPGKPVVVPFEQRVQTQSVVKGVRAYSAAVPAPQCFFTIDGSDRWSVQAIIRPLHHPQFEDACSLTGPPIPPSTGPVLPSSPPIASAGSPPQASVGNPTVRR
jgi:hypothetical protein